MDKKVIAITFLVLSVLSYFWCFTNDMNFIFFIIGSVLIALGIFMYPFKEGKNEVMELDAVE